MEFEVADLLRLRCFSAPLASIHPVTQVLPTPPAYADSLLGAGDRSERKSAVCGITGFLPRLASSQWPASHLYPQPVSGEPRGSCAPSSFPPAASACLRFQTKNMQQPIFQFGSEPQNTTNPHPPRLTVPRFRNGWLLMVLKRWILPSILG